MEVRDRQSLELDVDSVGGVTAIDGEAVELLFEAHRRLGTAVRLEARRGGPVHRALRREGVADVHPLRASRAEAPAAAGPR